MPSSPSSRLYRTGIYRDFLRRDSLLFHLGQSQKWLCPFFPMMVIAAQSHRAKRAIPEEDTALQLVNRNDPRFFLQEPSARSPCPWGGKTVPCSQRLKIFRNWSQERRGVYPLRASQGSGIACQGGEKPPLRPLGYQTAALSTAPSPARSPLSRAGPVLNSRARLGYGLRR